MIGCDAVRARSSTALISTALIMVLATFTTAAAQESGGAETAVEIPPVSLDDFNDYLERLTTAVGTFTQHNADGTTSTGRIYLNRPWKMRLEYNRPDAISIIANGLRLTVLDKKSNSGPAEYPLTGTGLHSLLAKSVNLADPRLLIRFRTDETYSEVHLRHTSRLVGGRSVIYFSNDPISLLGWSYIDDDRRQTTLILEEWQEGVRLRGSLFDPAQLSN